MFACERLSLNEAVAQVFLNIPTLWLSELSPDLPPRPEQWRAQEPSFPTGLGERRPGADY